MAAADPAVDEADARTRPVMAGPSTHDGTVRVAVSSASALPMQVVLVLASIVTLEAATPLGMAAGCLPYEPALVTVTGTAQRALGYGPPGFGEDPVHDAKEPYVLLTTDSPFCVSGGKPNSEDVNVSMVSTLQLAYGMGQHFDTWWPYRCDDRCHRR